jgi:hypothetical protein
MRGTVKIRVSSDDLAFIFLGKLRETGDCSMGLSIAVIPTNDGWKAVTNRPNRRHEFPRCAQQLETIEKRLRRSYTLAKD